VREDFGLSTERKMSKSNMNAYSKLLEIGNEELPEDVMSILQKEKQYQSAKQEWEKYQGWLRDRNPDRAALEAKYSFDCKHAAHLVRLYRMGREILEGKGVLVKRPDAEELLAIRNGAWKYDDLIIWAEKAEEEINAAYETTSLSKTADIHKLNQICMEIIQDYHR
jgi:hypothetical protein